MHALRLARFSPLASAIVSLGEGVGLFPLVHTHRRALHLGFLLRTLATWLGPSSFGMAVFRAHLKHQKSPSTEKTVAHHPRTTLALLSGKADSVTSPAGALAAALIVPMAATRRAPEARMPPPVFQYMLWFRALDAAILAFLKSPLP